MNAYVENYLSQAGIFGYMTCTCGWTEDGQIYVKIRDYNKRFLECVGIQNDSQPTQTVDIERMFCEEMNLHVVCAEMIRHQQKIRRLSLKRELVQPVHVMAETNDWNKFTIYTGVVRDQNETKMLDDDRDQSMYSEMEMILESTQDALFLIKLKQNVFTYVRNNRVHQQLMNVSQTEIYGKSPREILDEFNGKLLEEKCMECVETGDIVSFEEKIMIRGQEREILTKLTPVRRVRGPIKFIVGSRVDVTEPRSMGRSNAVLLKKYQSMFESHTAVMLIIDPLSGMIIDSNEAACDFYGYSKQEMEMMSIQDINQLSPAEVNMNRITAFAKQQKYFLFKHKLKDGSLRDVDVYSCPMLLENKQALFSIIFDVTQREESKRELFREKELLDKTLDTVEEGIITVDYSGNIMTMNRKSEELTGWKFIVGTNVPVTEVVVLRDVNTLIDRSSFLQEYRTENTSVRDDNLLLYPCGSHGLNYLIDCSVVPLNGYDGQITGAVIAFKDISEDRRRKQEIIYLSYHDALTGIFNRRYFDEFMKNVNEKREYPCAVVMGDVNGLKITNDIFGHEAGDELLKSIAHVLSDEVREKDACIRWGGDEFIIVMPETSENGVEGFLRRVSNILETESLHTIVNLNISFGYTILQDEKCDVEEALKSAEEKMYRTKMIESKSMRNKVVHSILATLDQKSTETKAHASRMRILCQEVGKELQLSQDEQDSLNMLSVLHDIGKIGIDERVLKKPGPLNDEEWDIMRKHSEIGYRIAIAIPEIRNVAELILHHHEKWDGTGYPKGLKCENIPRQCRVLSVVDAYDAMVNDRIYHKAVTPEAALSEIRAQSGKQFDPSVVEIFEHHMMESGFQLH